MKKNFLFLLSTLALLASCSAPTSSESSVPSSEEPSSSSLPSSESSNSSSESSSTEEYITVDWDEEDEVQTGMSIQDALIDISVNMILLTEYDYICNFSFTSTSSAGATFKVADNGVAEVINGPSNGSFYLVGHKEGETILKIYDASGFLHYRNKVSFRAEKSKKELLRFAYEEVDHYESRYARGTNITFISERTAIYSGLDEGVKINPITFTFEYSSQSDTEYFFTILDWPNSGSGTSLVATDLNIDKNGYALHICTRNGVIDVFTPVF